MSGPYRQQDELFDSERFRTDVLVWLARHRKNKSWLVDACGLGPGSTYGFLSGKSVATLLIVCSLANICDLSLDVYVRSPRGGLNDHQAGTP